MMRGLLIVFSFMVLFQGSTSINEHRFDDLSTLVDVTEKEGLKLEEWEVVFLEDLDKTSFEEVKLSLQSDHFVKKDKSENIHRYKFQPKSVENDVSYHIILIDPVHSPGNKRIQIVLSGTTWKEEISKQYEIMTNKLQRLYNL